ncbi:Acyltransferase easC-like protein [Cladobotryum mycophilum]|uniref:Acyltransferase easC-like protein n=1 Tax=Cladobotryum mycophilum TaxID=491253 RepID=A0ABR0SNP4_9HYPO
MTLRVLTEKTLIRPSISLVPGRMPVTPLDQYMVRVILPMMCIFQIDEPSLKPIIVQNLQTGLSNAIDELSFLAANIVPDSEEQSSIQLEYDDDAGVWFHTKDLPDMRYEELARQNFPFSSLTAAKFVPDPMGHSAKCPVLTVQATFITGGLVLTFSGHHAIMDAQGMGTFASVWSKYVAAAAEGLGVNDDERLGEDSLDASSTFGPSMERPLAEFPTYWCAEERSYEKMQARILETAVAGDHDELAKLIRLSHWSMSQSKLEELRIATAPRTVTGTSVTANATLSALIWKHVSRARRLSERQIASSSLLSSVNVRRRMDPPLAVEYPGNAIVLARATMTAAELESPGVESLYGIAQKIADSVDWWTPDEIWSLTGAIQACDNVANGMIPPLDYDLLVTSPSRLGDVLGKSRWGAELGSIKALRWAFPAFMDGFVVILPSIHGGVEIMLWTAHETDQRLKADPAWTQWVTQLL